MLLFYQKFSGNRFFTQNKDFSYFFTRTTSFLQVSYCIFIQYIEFSSLLLLIFLNFKVRFNLLY